MAFEREVASLAADAKCSARVGVGDEDAEGGLGLTSHRGIFAAQGEGEADSDFHLRRLLGGDFCEAGFDYGLAVWIVGFEGEDLAA